MSFQSESPACRKYSNDVVQLVETTRKSTFLSHDNFIMSSNMTFILHWRLHYRRTHHVKVLAFHGNQLEYNGSQGAKGAGSAGRIQPQGHETHGRSTTYALIQSLINRLL